MDPLCSTDYSISPLSREVCCSLEKTPLQVALQKKGIITSSSGSRKPFSRVWKGGTPFCTNKSRAAFTSLKESVKDFLVFSISGINSSTTLIDKDHNPLVKQVIAALLLARKCGVIL